MTQKNNNKLRILIDGSLPWDKQEGEDRRLYGIVIVLLILSLLIMIMVNAVTSPNRYRNLRSDSRPVKKHRQSWKRIWVTPSPGWTISAHW